MTFPTNETGKRQLMAELTAVAPDLVAEISTIRRTFPQAKLTYLRMNDGREYGTASPEGVTPNLYAPARMSVVQQENKRLDKKASEARKRKK